MTQRNIRILKGNAVTYMFITPQSLFFGLFLVYPAIEGFYLSMFNVSFFDETFCGLDNYRSLFTDPISYRAVRNTLIMVLWTTVITVGADFFISSSVFDKRAGYIIFIRGSYYIPTVISMVVYSIIWKWTLSPSFGIVYYILGEFGVRDLNLLGNYGYVLYVLILLICVVNVGQAIVLYVATIQGIGTTLMESVRIDGASGVDVLRSIVYPLVRPTTFYLVIIDVIGVMKVFAIVNVMTNGGPNYASSSPMYLYYTEAFRSSNQDRASVIGVMMFLVTFMISLIPLKLFRRKG